jgi:hypothetical protein
MEPQYSFKVRKELRLKMGHVFGEEIQMLSDELQETLLDDLVTAFENRLKALNRAQSSVTFEMARNVEYETFQT